MSSAANHQLRLAKGSESADFLFADSACMWAAGDDSGSTARVEAQDIIDQMLANGWSVTYSNSEGA